MGKAYHWWTFAKLPVILVYDTIHPQEDSPHWLAICPGPGFKCGVFLACLKSYKLKLSNWKPYLTIENWHTPNIKCMSSVKDRVQRAIYLFWRRTQLETFGDQVFITFVGQEGPSSDKLKSFAKICMWQINRHGESLSNIS
jgi:hypothetical protein